jgi:hypothetical protein
MLGKSGALALCISAVVMSGQLGAQGIAPVQAKLKDVYVTMLGSALPDIARGEAMILDASGKKDQAAALRASADKMTQGAAQDPSEDLFKASVTSVSDGASKSADTLNTKSGELSAEAKQQFIDGLTKYVMGTVKLKSLKGDAESLSAMIGPATKGLSMMDAVRARGTISLAKTVATGVPDVTAKSISGLQAIKAFAAARNIPIPANLLQGM